MIQGEIIMMKKRDDSIDIAKALGIILVVLGHTEFVYSNFLYQFHMPLFFFLSGFVFNESKTKPFGRFALKKIKGLYLPFVVFELIFLCFHNLFVSIGFYSVESGKELIYYGINDYMKKGFQILTMGGGEQLCGPVWFLISSLEIVIVFALLFKLVNFLKINDIYKESMILLICIGLFFVGCYTHLPRMLSQSMIGILFFCVGYLYKKHKNRIKLHWYFAVISLAVIIVTGIFNKVDISKLEITYTWMLLISGIAGSYLILWLSGLIVRVKHIGFLKYCGKNTIYILALHFVSFKLVMIAEWSVYRFDWVYLGSFPTYEESFWWQIPLTIAGVGIPLLIKLFVDKTVWFISARMKPHKYRDEESAN